MNKDGGEVGDFDFDDLDMSMQADADRMSQIISARDRANMLEEQIPHTDPMQHAIKQINERSRKFNKKQDKLLKKRDAFQHIYKNKFTKNDLMSIHEWKEMIFQTKNLDLKQLELIRFTIVNKGTPEKLRGKIWVKLFDIEGAADDHASNIYSNLCEFSNKEAEKMIAKDVARTLSDLKLFREDSDGGNNKLFNVLKAYSNYDNEVGYVQGLNYIVGLLLLYI